MWVDISGGSGGRRPALATRNRHSEKCADPPRRNDSPADSEQGWRLGVKEWRVIIAPVFLASQFLKSRSRCGIYSTCGMVDRPVAANPDQRCFMKLHRIFVVSYATGWLVKLIIIAVISGCFLHS